MATRGLANIGAEIIHQRLISIVQEAEAVILRTAYSSTIAEAQDFAAAVYAADQRLVAQTRRALGGFVGTLGRGLRGVLREIPPETLRPGDTIITNDRWLAAGHLPDILTVRPIFNEDLIIGYATNIAHVSDVGGKPTADAVDGFEEGLHIPPCFLYRSDRINDDVLRFIRANTRLPHQIVGDVQAQNSANALIEQRVRELRDEYRMADLAEVSDLLQHRAEQAMRQRIARLPDGAYEAETYSDGADRPIRLAARITVAGDGIDVDFAGTDPQVRWGLNVPFNMTCSEALYALRSVLGPDIPLLEGSFTPFTFRAPSGCILNPVPPAATQVRTVVAHNINSLVYRALAPLVPDYIDPARICANFGGLWTFRFRGNYTEVPSAYVNGGPPQIAGSYTESYFFSGGSGALGDRDGQPGVPMPANCANIPIEVMESRAPVLFERKVIVPDTGGAGLFRGGPGQRVDVRVLSDVPIDFIPGTNDRMDNRPFGLFGGGEGSGGQMAIDGVPAHRRNAQAVTRGQLITVAVPGGGGCGDPAERPPDAVDRDVELGYITEEARRSTYDAGSATDRPARLRTREVLRDSNL